MLLEKLNDFKLDGKTVTASKDNFERSHPKLKVYKYESKRDGIINLAAFT